MEERVVPPKHALEEADDLDDDELDDSPSSLPSTSLPPSSSKHTTQLANGQSSSSSNGSSRPSKRLRTSTANPLPLPNSDPSNTSASSSSSHAHSYTFLSGPHSHSHRHRSAPRSKQKPHLSKFESIPPELLREIFDRYADACRPRPTSTSAASPMNGLNAAGGNDELELITSRNVLTGISVTLRAQALAYAPLWSEIVLGLDLARLKRAEEQEEARLQQRIANPQGLPPGVGGNGATGPSSSYPTSSTSSSHLRPSHRPLPTERILTRLPSQQSWIPAYLHRAGLHPLTIRIYDATLSSSTTDADEREALEWGPEEKEEVTARHYGPLLDLLGGTIERARVIDLSRLLDAVPTVQRRLLGAELEDDEVIQEEPQLVSTSVGGAIQGGYWQWQWHGGPMGSSQEIPYPGSMVASDRDRSWWHQKTSFPHPPLNPHPAADRRYSYQTDTLFPSQPNRTLAQPSTRQLSVPRLHTLLLEECDCMSIIGRYRLPFLLPNSSSKAHPAPLLRTLRIYDDYGFPFVRDHSLGPSLRFIELTGHTYSTVTPTLSLLALCPSLEGLRLQVEFDLVREGAEEAEPEKDAIVEAPKLRFLDLGFRGRGLQWIKASKLESLYVSRLNRNGDELEEVLRGFMERSRPSIKWLRTSAVDLVGRPQTQSPAVTNGTALGVTMIPRGQGAKSGEDRTENFTSLAETALKELQTLTVRFFSNLELRAVLDSVLAASEAGLLPALRTLIFKGGIDTFGRLKHDIYPEDVVERVDRWARLPAGERGQGVVRVSTGEKVVSWHETWSCDMDDTESGVKGRARLEALKRDLKELGLGRDAFRRDHYDEESLGLLRTLRGF